MAKFGKHGPVPNGIKLRLVAKCPGATVLFGKIFSDGFGVKG